MGFLSVLSTYMASLTSLGSIHEYSETAFSKHRLLFFRCENPRRIYWAPLTMVSVFSPWFTCQLFITTGTLSMIDREWHHPTPLPTYKHYLLIPDYRRYMGFPHISFTFLTNHIPTFTKLYDLFGTGSGPLIWRVCATVSGTVSNTHGSPCWREQYPWNSDHWSPST